MKLGYKEYASARYPFKALYLTLNGVQIGTVKLSMSAVLESMKRLEDGRDDWDAV